MARPALSEEELEAFRRKAVNVATRLFAERGYSAVTMRALAAELGVSPMAPYRYFENKADLFARVRTDAYRRFADTQETAFRSASEPLARLIAMRNAYVHFAVEHANEYRVMFELAQEPEERFPALAEQSGRAFRCLENAVRQAIAAGAVQGEPTTVAHQLWSSVHGMVTLHLAGKLRLGRTLDELLNAAPLRLGP